MDSENQFWLRIWQTVAIGFCVTVVSIGGCVSNTHYQIAKALDKGVDPLMVACAHDNEGAGTPCIIAASKR